MACYGLSTCTVGTAIRLKIFLHFSFISFAIGYMFHSRSDPCLALEPEYAVGGQDCGKEWIYGMGKALGIWLGCVSFMGFCYCLENFIRAGHNNWGKVHRFFARLVLEFVETGALILSSVVATEASGHVTMKNCKPLENEVMASVSCIISVFCAMAGLRSSRHYGVFDIIYATFLSVLLGLGKTNLLGMVTAASICCSYRVLLFIAKEVKRCFGYADPSEQLIDAVHAHVTQSRTFLNALDANLPGGGNDLEANLPANEPDGPIQNLRNQLNILERAIPNP